MQPIKNTVNQQVNKMLPANKKKPVTFKSKIVTLESPDIGNFNKPTFKELVKNVPKPTKVNSDDSLDSFLDEMVGPSRSQFMMRVEWIKPTKVYYKKTKDGKFLLDSKGNKIIDATWNYRGDRELREQIKAGYSVKTELGALFTILRRIKGQYLWCRIWNNAHDDIHKREIFRHYIELGSVPELNRLKEEVEILKFI